MDTYTYNDLQNPQEEFHLSTSESFRIPLRRNNKVISTLTPLENTNQHITSNLAMYEQSLDYDTFNSYLSQNGIDSNESRFYDDFFNLATQSTDWKINKKLPGLPTPPATPDTFCYEPSVSDKFQQENFMPSTNSSSVSVRYNNDTIEKSQFEHINNSYEQHGGHQRQQQKDMHSPGLQVVPETTEEPQNEWKWFHSRERNDSSPVVSGNYSRFPPPQQHYGSHNLSPQIHHAQDIFCNTTQLTPDYLLSPVSPQRNLKRSYPFNPTTSSYVNHTSASFVNSGSSPTPVMSSMPRHFQDHEIPQINGMRSSDENYYRQLAYEKMRAYQKVQDIDDSEPQGELSRATHNVLERQRRNDLKLRFNILRDNIPELANNDKAPKIQILKKALEHLAELRSQEQTLMVDLELERQRKLILLNRLKALQDTF